MKSFAMTIAALVALSPLAASAQAYRTLADELGVDSSPLIVWAPGELTIDLVASGEESPRQLLLARVVDDAMSLVSAPTCSTLRLRSSASSARVRATVGDGVSSIEWVTSGWAARGLPAGVPATTEVVVQSVDGAARIVEADIFVNAADYRWRGLGGGETDLRLLPVVMHELLHAVGLAHPCELHDEDRAPLCSVSPDEVLASVLHPSYAELEPRLAAIDVEGLCALYPLAPCVGEGCAIPCPADCSVPCREPDVCPACAHDEDCAADEHCRAGTCEPTAPLGARCDVDRACESDFCPDGRCSIPCYSIEGCPAGFRCASSGWCRAEELDRAPCESSRACASRRCLLPLEGSGHCTNSCRTDAQCLLGETCESISGEQVCVRVSSGCGASRQAPASSFGLGLFALAGFVLVRRGRTRPGDR